MDWSRAKTILIIVLLFLNIFLLAMIIFSNPASLFAGNYNKYALDYLKSRNIRINTDIPNYSGPTSKIIYTAREFDPDKLCILVFGGTLPVSFNGNDFSIEKGEESLSLTGDLLHINDKLSDGGELFGDPDKLMKRLLKYLNELGFKRKNIIAGEIGNKDGAIQVEFYLKYKNNMVFDQIITARIDSNGLLTIWAPAKDISKGNGKGDILSAYHVLVTGGLPSGVSIEDVDFGYKQVSESDIYGTPVWRVILGDGTVLYYNAYTGVRI